MSKEKRHFDVQKIRSDFPILTQRVHGKPLVYLDNASTTQKPRQVIDAMTAFYEMEYSNIHRAVYHLSEAATARYEGVRAKVKDFINASSTSEIIFARGTTEVINLVAQSFGRAFVKEGDEVLITTMEHHSNIVPWQILCEERGAKLKIVPISDDGEILLAQYQKMLSKKTRIVAVTHISNVLGTINPIKEMVHLAKGQGVPVLIDGAQAAAHVPIDVQDLGCDFYAFSAHKMYGPTGIGVLYGRETWLERMPPYQGGGDMISSVTFEKTHYNILPFKFEAGTPNITAGIGFGAALDYVKEIGFSNIEAHEGAVVAYALKKLEGVPCLRIIGQAKERVGVISFVMEKIHPHDLGTVLDREGIAIRTGHHCAQPLMDRFEVPATARASFGIYNTKEEVDALVAGIEKAEGIFK